MRITIYIADFDEKGHTKNPKRYKGETTDWMKERMTMLRAGLQPCEGTHVSGCYIKGYGAAYKYENAEFGGETFVFPPEALP